MPVNQRGSGWYDNLDIYHSTNDQAPYTSMRGPSTARFLHSFDGRTYLYLDLTQVTTNSNTTQSWSIEEYWQQAVQNPPVGVTLKDALNSVQQFLHFDEIHVGTNHGAGTIRLRITEADESKVDMLHHTDTPGAAYLYLDPLSGSGDIPNLQRGCTDPDANNYNPAAGIDDGSCKYDSEDTSTSGPTRYPDVSIYTTANKTLHDVVPTEAMVYTGEPLPITLDMRNIVYKRSSLNEILPHDFKSY